MTLTNTLLPDSACSTLSDLVLLEQSLPKNSFRYEAHLIDLVMRNLSVFLPRTHATIASKEVGIGAGTVDVLLAVPNVQQLLAGLQDKAFVSKKVTGKSAVVLTHLHMNQPLKAETIAKNTRLDEQTTLTILNELMASGFVSQLPSGTFVRTLLSQQFEKMVSIEGKLSNWRQALSQAYRNKLFSMYSYVVLDGKNVRPAIKGLAQFKKLGVGLAIGSADNETICILYRPPISKPISSIFYLQATEAMRGKIINRQEVFLSKGLQNAF
jgi:hypothetical protein